MGVVRDPYRILGVEPDADDHAIRAAYRRRARETHPDRGGSDEAFREVRAAYDTLRDTSRRTQWRAAHERDERVTTAAASGPAGASGERPWWTDARGPSYQNPNTRHVNETARRRREAEAAGRARASAAEAARRAAAEAAAKRVWAYRADPAVTTWWPLGGLLSALGLVLASLGRGFGLLPHATVGAGEHLVLGNWVMRGSFWAGMTSLHHGWVIAVAAELGVYAMVIALPWLRRGRAGRAVRWWEIVGQTLVVAALSSAAESVGPQMWSVAAYLGLVWLWRNGWRTTGAGTR